MTEKRRLQRYIIHYTKIPKKVSCVFSKLPTLLLGCQPAQVGASPVWLSLRLLRAQCPAAGNSYALASRVARACIATRAGCTSAGARKLSHKNLAKKGILVILDLIDFLFDVLMVSELIHISAEIKKNKNV